MQITHATAIVDAQTLLTEFDISPYLLTYKPAHIVAQIMGTSILSK